MIIAEACKDATSWPDVVMMGLVLAATVVGLWVLLRPW